MSDNFFYYYFFNSNIRTILPAMQQIIASFILLPHVLSGDSSANFIIKAKKFFIWRSLA